MKKLPKKSDTPQQGIFIIKDFPQLLAMVFALFFAAFALDISSVKTPQVKPVNYVAANEAPQIEVKTSQIVLADKPPIVRKKRVVKQKKQKKKATPVRQVQEKSTVEAAPAASPPEKSVESATIPVRRPEVKTVATLPGRNFVPESRTMREKYTAINKLPGRVNKPFAVPNAVVFNFEVKPNKYKLPAREIEALVETPAMKPKEKTTEKTEELKSTEVISADFRFRADLQKQPTFISSADGKTAYSTTTAGVLLQLKENAALDSQQGIFVERSTDGKEFYSIGIINPTDKNTLSFFDGEVSDADRHYYRFRSQGEDGQTFTFGDIVCRQNRNLTLHGLGQSKKGIFSVDLHARFSGNVNCELRDAVSNRLIERHSKRLVAGDNALDIALNTEALLLKLTIKSGAEHLDLLLENTGEGLTQIVPSAAPRVMPVSNKTTHYVNTSVLRRELLPLSIYDRRKEKNWKIPGLKNCPGLTLTVFNEWGLPVYHEKKLTPENVWNGSKDGEEIPAGMYSYVLGARGGWVQLI